MNSCAYTSFSSNIYRLIYVTQIYACTMTIHSTFWLQTHSPYSIYLYALISYLSMCDIIAKKKSDREKKCCSYRKTLYARWSTNGTKTIAFLLSIRFVYIYMRFNLYTPSGWEEKDKTILCINKRNWIIENKIQL